MASTMTIRPTTSMTLFMNAPPGCQAGSGGPRDVKRNRRFRQSFLQRLRGRTSQSATTLR